MLDLFQKYEGLENAEIRKGQIIYLHNLGYTPCEIKQYVDLAISTIRNYIYKFADMLEWAKSIFKVTKRKIKAFFDGQDVIQWECETTTRKMFTYIVAHYNNEGNFVWLKVGQTTVGVKRLWQHLDEAPYLKENVTYIRVKKIFNFEDKEDTKIMESLLKQHYEKDPLNDYVKEDRFKGIMFTEEDLQNDKILQEKMKIIM